MRNLSDTDAFTLTILPMHVPFFNSVKNAPDEVVWSAAFAKLTWQVSLSLSLSLSLCLRQAHLAGLYACPLSVLGKAVSTLGFGQGFRA